MLSRNFRFSMIALAVSSSTTLAAPSDKYLSILENHNLVVSAEERLASAKSEVSVEKSAWYPELRISADGGREKYDRDTSPNTDLDTNEYSANLNQLVWDFGKVSAAVAYAESKVDRASLVLDRQKQYLILAGLEAELNLKKALTVLDFARQSENNIKKQTQLESSRIALGQGYTTDLLQAKTQLAAANVRRVMAEGDLEQARNRYTAVFNQTAPSSLNAVNVPELNLSVPKNLQAALDATLNNNPDISIRQSDFAISQADVIRTKKSEWMPEIRLNLEHTDSSNPDGIEQERTQNAVLLTMNWRYSLGQRASAAEAAAKARSRAAAMEVENQRIQTIEDTKNAWTQLRTSEARVSYLTNQVELAQSFLELARKERELGKRSLLDVLNGETQLINAQSDVEAAKTDLEIAKLQLMLQTGQLSLNVFK